MSSIALTVIGRISEVHSCDQRRPDSMNPSQVGAEDKHLIAFKRLHEKRSGSLLCPIARARYYHVSH